jgi:hypothetical protein
MDGGSDAGEANLVSHGQRDFGDHVTGVFGDDGGSHDLICPLADVHPDHAIGFTIEQGAIHSAEGLGIGRYFQAAGLCLCGC